MLQSRSRFWMRGAVACALAMAMSTVVSATDEIPRPAPYSSWSTADRDDYDAGEMLASADAALVCSFGGRSARYPSPGIACVVAHEENLAARDYARAMKHAAAGCVQHRDVASCRRLAGLPIVIGNSGGRVPSGLARHLREAAAAICASERPLHDIIGRDVSARECMHLAGRFVLSQDPEYRTALAAPTARFFRTIHDPARYGRLTQLACARAPQSDACARARTARPAALVSAE